MITPQLATQEVRLGSPPPLPRDGEVQERLEDRRGGLAVVIGAELHRERRRGRQGNVADAMASKAASLLRRGFQLVFDPFLLVDQRSHARGLSIGPESRIVLVIEPQQLAEPPAAA